jgi:hypothetical protein
LSPQSGRPIVSFVSSSSPEDGPEDREPAVARILSADPASLPGPEPSAAQTLARSRSMEKVLPTTAAGEQLSRRIGVGDVIEDTDRVLREPLERHHDVVDVVVVGPV